MNMTIAAIATPVGEGGIGIVRLSGEHSLKIVNKMFKGCKRDLTDTQPNRLVYGTVIDSEGQVVDEALAVFMRAPHSYTAEDVVEIQCHGSRASLERVLGLTLHYGARLANPGEFTQRAFLNGRLDLSQAEAVLDIIKARTQASLKLAMRQHRGLLSEEITAYRRQLMDLIVQLEAVIDYPEEEIEDVTCQQVSLLAQETQGALEKLIQSCKVGKVLKEGLRVVITGRPNVGKSSLLNLLLKEERAIVSGIAGTTRDIIEEQLIIGGIPIVLVDTAGVREAADEIEKIGVQKAYENINSADLVLDVLDAQVGFTEEDKKILDSIQQERHIILVNKIDVQQDMSIMQRQLQEFSDVVYLSVLTGEGLDEFREILEKVVFGSGGYNLDDNVYVQNVRHEQLIQEAYQAVKESLDSLQQRMPLDCVVIDLRRAVDSLGLITGDSITGEIINEIFSRFCIGK